MSEADQPKIIVDSEWKSRVETEKKRLKQQEHDQPPPQGELPTASFPVLVSTLASQALVTLGQIPDPYTGKSELHLTAAKHFIDTLAMLAEKTTGNLLPDEAAMLTDVIHQLRLAYVEISGAAAPPAAGKIQIP
jgi:hypothetical protein